MSLLMISFWKTKQQLIKKEYKTTKEETQY